MDHIKFRANPEGNQEVEPMTDAGLKAVSQSLRQAVLGISRGELVVPGDSWLSQRRNAKTIRSLAETGLAAYDSFARSNTSPSIPRGNGPGLLPVEQAIREYEVAEDKFIVTGIAVEVLEFGSTYARREANAKYERDKSWRFAQEHTLRKAQAYNEEYFKALGALANQ